MLYFLLSFLGCSEPIPIKSGPTNLAQDIPKEPPRNSNEESVSGGAMLDRNSSGCRTTQFWASEVADAKTLTISGQMLNEEEFPVPFLIDVVSVEKKAVVFGTECAKNYFSFEIPKDLGTVWFFVFADLDGTGPSKGDPQGRSEELEIGTKDIEDLQIKIYKQRPVEEAYLLGPPMKSDGQQPNQPAPTPAADNAQNPDQQPPIQGTDNGQTGKQESGEQREDAQPSNQQPPTQGAEK